MTFRNSCLFYGLFNDALSSAQVIRHQVLGWLWWWIFRTWKEATVARL